MSRTDRTTPEARRLVIGTMTGTSIDGDLDAAVVAIDGHGLESRAELVAHASWPLGTLADDLRRIAGGDPTTAGDFARIARAFGDAHADAAERLWLDSHRRRRALGAAADLGAGPDLPDLIVLHGQTVFHAPPLTWQLIDPWPTAIRLGCRVRYDLRGASVASGGEGAPITPLSDFVLFGLDEVPRLVLNLGGFINVTFVPPRSSGIDAIRGFDACAANHLLDRVARDRIGAAYDDGGAAALSGTADPGLVRVLSTALAPDGPPGLRRRSLGTADAAAGLVDLTRRLDASDACRTIVEAIADATARVIATELPKVPDDVLVAGGSARNRALTEALGRRLGAAVRRTDDACGVPVEAREAAGIAILGALADDGVRYSLPQVAGAASRAPESALIGAHKARER